MRKFLLISLYSFSVWGSQPKHHHTKVKVVVDKSSPTSSSSSSDSESRHEHEVKEEKHKDGESKKDPELVAARVELKKDWTKLKIACVSAATMLVGAGAGAGVAWLSGRCK